MIEFHKFDSLTIVIAVLFAACLYLLWSRKRSNLAVVWRVINIGILLLIALQPKIVSYLKDSRPVVVAAVDVSESMGMTGRIIAAQKFLENHGQELGKRFRLKLYGFASGSGEVKNIEQLTKAHFGNGTDIVRSLFEIKRETGENLSGIMLFSDGNHNAGPARERWAAELNVPVFPVALGIGKKVRDAAVVSVKAEDFAFKNTPFEITAVVSAIGCAGKTLNVKLSQVSPEPKEIGRRSFAAASSRETKEITFPVTPYTSGEFKYRVEVEPVENEITLLNNAKSFNIEVVRDKLRVLFLCGQPGPEYAFLRQALKNDPLVELVTFVILRRPENIALASDADLALIPFPVQSIFRKDLFNFDILILENFTYKGYGFYPEYFSNIRRWVMDKGGGLIMTGGENSFASGGWYETPVGDVLPVYAEGPSIMFEKGFFRPSVENYSHPIMTVDDDPSKNAQAWRDAPELETCQALKIKPGAVLLAKDRQGGWAAISACDSGKGRAVAIGTDTTWRWALQSGTPDFYAKFWKNTVRFAARRSDSKKLRLAFDRPQYFEGQDYNMKVRSSEGMALPSVDITVTDASGKRVIAPAKKINDKEWIISGRFESSGEYRFTAAFRPKGMTVFEETRVQNVSPSKALEESELDDNTAFLKNTADVSGGQYFTAEAFSLKNMAAKLKETHQKEEKGEKPLWDSPWLLAFLVLSIVAELLFRRMVGLL